MGYTHYYNFKSVPKNITDGDKKFSKAVELFKKGLEKANNKVTVTYNVYDEKTYAVKETITKEIPLNLRGGMGTGKPIITDTLVCFNGDRESGRWCESFYLSYDKKMEGIETFCKTSREPYDFAVCLALLCFKHTFGDDFHFSSDGDIEGGEEGWGKAKEIFDTLI